MRTVSRALTILDLFSEQIAQLSLVEVATATGIDRATCFRMLKVLDQHGYVTKDHAKKYRLGPTVLRLARTREATAPVSGVLQAAVDRLTASTGETAHATLIAGHQVATIAVCDGIRNTQVRVERGGRLAVHATASGLACLAFGDEAFLKAALAQPLEAFTPSTLTEPRAIAALLHRTRERGYSIADRSFDADVVGLAVPIFGAEGYAIGALAAATPSSRMDADVERRTAAALQRAALETSRELGGAVPGAFAAKVLEMAA